MTEKNTEESSRVAVPKRLRFEVFKRDKFTCQYCGAKAPDVVLHIDHINPVAAGGGNDILNLATACAGCNLGKSNKLLSENAVLEAQRSQLEELQERRDQIEMMLEWRESLSKRDETEVGAAVRVWGDLAPGYEPTELALTELRKLLKKYGLSRVLGAMDASAETYLVHTTDRNGDVVTTEESWNLAWKKLGPICYISEQSSNRPHLKDAAYIGGIAKRRFGWGAVREVRETAERCLEAGACFDSLKSIAVKCDDSDSLIAAMNRYLEQQ